MNCGEPIYCWVWLTLCMIGCTQEAIPTASISSNTKVAKSLAMPTDDDVPQEHLAFLPPTAETAQTLVQPIPSQESEISVPSRSNTLHSLVKGALIHVENKETTAAVIPRGRDFDNLSKPIVKLSGQHEKTCLVKIGDVFPSLTVTTLSGDVDSLSNYYGDRLTVVVFWTNKQPYALQQYKDLENDILEPYGPDGVSVIATNVGDSIEEVEGQMNAYGRSFSNFVDPDRTAFYAVATRKLPRSYLLDANGKIVWFDIEYSQSTRRELDWAIRYFLSGQS